MLRVVGHAIIVILFQVTYAAWSLDTCGGVRDVYREAGCCGDAQKNTVAALLADAKETLDVPMPPRKFPPFLIDEAHRTDAKLREFLHAYHAHVADPAHRLTGTDCMPSAHNGPGFCFPPAANGKRYEFDLGVYPAPPAGVARGEHPPVAIRSETNSGYAWKFYDAFFGYSYMAPEGSGIPWCKSMGIADAYNPADPTQVFVPKGNPVYYGYQKSIVTKGVVQYDFDTQQITFDTTTHPHRYTMLADVAFGTGTTGFFVFDMPGGPTGTIVTADASFEWTGFGVLDVGGQAVATPGFSYYPATPSYAGIDVLQDLVFADVEGGRATPVFVFSPNMSKPLYFSA